MCLYLKVAKAFKAWGKPVISKKIDNHSGPSMFFAPLCVEHRFSRKKLDS
jgi:hypothetical protein